MPRFKLESAVLRVPVVPGCDPRAAYGDLVDRGEALVGETWRHPGQEWGQLQTGMAPMCGVVRVQGLATCLSACTRQHEQAW